MGRLRIFLLGRFSVEVDGRVLPATAWRKKRPVELLAALALAPGRVLHREELIDRLWPDKDLDAGANNLHRALHDLRLVLDQGSKSTTPFVTLDRGVVRLDEGAWVDVEAFERGATSSLPDELTQAMELYRGPLLPDDPYSEALLARREGLRQRFIDGGLRLAKLHQAAGAREACIAISRRMLAEDPALEPAHQLLMRVLAESGRIADALRQFGECTTALRERLDASPNQATFELRSAIERGELAAPVPPAERAGATANAQVRRLLGEAELEAALNDLFTSQNRSSRKNATSIPATFLRVTVTR